mmetsp:Transcript_2811/g.4737  ORF Transcript_2811/g.4737 Transcript_2811/m.4737 type:complete len:431 (-) Transcript_2811:173-1465(-)|eukprot:CAMPEP_0198213938 /NCGR_PEP_ID=MMETSP1445-20131203/35480_1 /TAXON_ID=36898 /ORGANISM="Pyramimonas sp., Strain CCMP2087" /LENGTH=430 /DNA_ID=CAMNT_0043888817 /DNA_START=347 /DNA_END=1639 /DNA_ORIENTATION=+
MEEVVLENKEDLEKGCSLDGATRRAAVIGAGISGLVCAEELSKQGFKVTVFEAGRGVGGRMATRRVDLEDGKQVQFDHGCQFFTVSNPEFESLVLRWEKVGAIAKWKGRVAELSAVSKKTGFSDKLDENRVMTTEMEKMDRWVGTPSMNAVCKCLASSKGLTVCNGVRVCGFQRPETCLDGKWGLEMHPTAHPFAEDEVVGGFDVVVVSDKTLASTRTLMLYGKPPPLESAGVSSLLNKMQSLSQQPAFALMLAFKEPINIPYDGLIVMNHSMISSAVRNDSKPARDGKGVQQWLVLSTASYSNNLVYGNRLTQAGTDKHRNILNIVADEMSTCFSEILKQYFKDDVRLPPKPVLKIAHRWASAFPVLGSEGAKHFFADDASQIYACGDYCNAAGGRACGMSEHVEQAALSGLYAARHIAKVIPIPLDGE